MRNDVLIEIARILTTEASLTEALRLVAREVARLAGAVTWSADVQHAPRFGFALFHMFPHRSGVVVPTADAVHEPRLT